MLILEMRSLPIRLESIGALLVLAAALVIFALQLRSLYTVPVFDSVRWGGDETWLMREFGNQIEYGAMSYPESFGGPRRTDGVLAGSMWVDAMIYGLPGTLLFPAHDFVSVGRGVTAILAFILLASIYFISRKLKVPPLLSALTVLLVVACRGFLWAMHSARYDLLTGLTLIWFCYFLSRENNPSHWRMGIIGLVGAIMICFSRHMLLLGLAASLAFLFEKRVWKQPSHGGYWLTGSVIGAVILSIAYGASAHEFSLFGSGGSEGSYSFVLNQIPLLRPFSRNVQVSNLVERFHLFGRDAPGILVIVCGTILLGIIYLLSRQRKIGRLVQPGPTKRRFWFAAAAFCTLTWLLTEGARPYYLFHIIPMMAIAGALAFSRLQAKWPTRYATLVLFAIAIALGGRSAIPNGPLGQAIARDQRGAITKFLNEASISAPRKSRVLLDVAGLDRALTDTSRKDLTLDMFQPPHEADALVQKLRSNKIDYVILRSSPVGAPFEPGRALLPQVLDSIGTIRDTAIGFFYDDGRTYDASMGELLRQGMDTLKLYRLSE